MMQEEQAQAAAETPESGVDLGDLLMDHAADHYSLHFEPFPPIEWDPHLLEFQLAGLTVNMTPTKHLIYMVFAAANTPTPNNLNPIPIDHRYSGLGCLFAVGVLAFMGGGWLLDRWLNTLPA